MPAILLFVSFSLKKPKLRSGTNTLPKDSITGPFLYSTPPYAHRLINIEQTKSPYPLMTHMFKYSRIGDSYVFIALFFNNIWEKEATVTLRNIAAKYGLIIVLPPYLY
jgi:hypothetical protein